MPIPRAVVVRPGAVLRGLALALALAACAALAPAAARADDIVITIGTTSFSHVESDLRQVRAAVDDLLPLLRPGHALILRSTIAPGTTEFVAGYLEKRRDLRVGEDPLAARRPGGLDIEHGELDEIRDAREGLEGGTPVHGRRDLAQLERRGVEQVQRVPDAYAERERGDVAELPRKLGW